MTQERFKEGFGYNDLSIVPAEVSYVSSRQQCLPYYVIDAFKPDSGPEVPKKTVLPIFTAPMSTIVNKDNINLWSKNHVVPIVPRNIELDLRIEFLKSGEWVAFSLTEFKSIFCFENDAQKYNYINELKSYSKLFFSGKYRVCIDVANGHMNCLYDAVLKAKKNAVKYSLEIMIGNIANPKTYEYLCEKKIPVDYVRLNIGGGAGCLTYTNTGVHYPIASLIDECYKISCKYNDAPKIIADGGVKNYSDVIKALALGADYVMIGSIFAGLLESAAPLCFSEEGQALMEKDHVEVKKVEDFDKQPVNGVYRFSKWMDYKTKVLGVFPKRVKITYIDYYVDLSGAILMTNLNRVLFMNDIKKYKPYKEFYGMSTPYAQKLINSSCKIKTSEGCHKKLDVELTLDEWVENMTDYLRSAMSYAGKAFLESFKGGVELIINSPAERMNLN